MLGLMQRPKLIRLCLVEEDGADPYYLVVLDKLYAIRTKAGVEIRCVREKYSVQPEAAFEHKCDGSSVRVKDRSPTLEFLLGSIHDRQRPTLGLQSNLDGIERTYISPGSLLRSYP